MNNLSERLLEVMAELGIKSPRDLSVFCGVSEGLVSQWFAGTTKLGAKPLKALGRTHFSLDWIVSGVTPKYRSNTSGDAPTDPSALTAVEVIRLIELYSLVGPDGRKEVVNFAEAVLDSQADAPSKLSAQN